jgi:hypothetical protein
MDPSLKLNFYIENVIIIIWYFVINTQKLI